MEHETDFMEQMKYIVQLALAVGLLLLLTFAPAMAQTLGYTGQTSTFAVDSVANDSYEWQLYSDSTVNFAVVPGDNLPVYAEFVGGNLKSSVDVLWKKAGTYFFKVIAYSPSGCTMNFKMGRIVVKVGVKVDITPPTEEICEGEPMSLELIFTGTAPWSFTYTATDVNGVVTTHTVTEVLETPYILKIDPGPTKTSDFTVITVSDKFGTNTEPSNTVTQIVNPLPPQPTIYHR